MRRLSCSVNSSPVSNGGYTQPIKLLRRCVCEVSIHFFITVKILENFNFDFSFDDAGSDFFKLPVVQTPVTSTNLFDIILKRSKDIFC